MALFCYVFYLKNTGKMFCLVLWYGLSLFENWMFCMPSAKSQSHKKNWGEQVTHGVERKQELGNTNTPLNVAEYIVNKIVVSCDVNNPGRWLEPAVGAGNFYIACLKRFQQLGGDPYVLAQHFDALDIDKTAIEVFKKRLQETFNWSVEQTESLPIYIKSLVDFTPTSSYDWIVTNPPYLAPKNWAKTDAERSSLVAAWQSKIPQADKRADLFIYFFHWCHNHLAPNGRSVFLCSDGWLDSGYGQTLRQEVLTAPYQLETVIAWPWKALFRDDTCPIVTVVRNAGEHANQLPTNLIVDDRNPLDNDQKCYTLGENAVWSTQISHSEMQKWFEHTSNRRQRLVTSPPLYNALNTHLNACKNQCVPLKDIAVVTGVSYSAQDLLKANIMREKSVAETTPADVADKQYPVFFQTQARVGKPVDYRQFRTTQSLSHYVVLGGDGLSQKVQRTGFRTGGVWISQAIDRFPLVFTQDPQDASVPWVAVSKYLHAQPKNRKHDAVLAAVLTSTPVLLAMDRALKEGTRKTLRVNENGFAKEIRRTDVENLLVPDYTNWSNDVINQITELQSKRGVLSLHRMDEAVKNEHWQALDHLIMTQMGLTKEQQDQLQATALALYWRRMRNVLLYGAAAENVLGTK